MCELVCCVCNVIGRFLRLETTVPLIFSQQCTHFSWRFLKQNQFTAQKRYVSLVQGITYKYRCNRLYVHVYIYIAVACYSTLKNDTDLRERFYGVCHHSCATCVTLKCTSEASELKTDLWKAEAKLHKLVHSQKKSAQCMHARGLLCLQEKLSATSVQ